MNYDYLNTNIYKSAVHAFRNSLPTALTFAAILLIVEFLTPILGLKASITFMPEMFLEIGMAFAIHTFILTGVSNSWKDLILVKNEAYSYKPFMWRSLAFVAMFLAVLAIVWGLTILCLPHLTGDIKVMILGTFFILFVIVGLPLTGVLFAVFGTVLPAAVAEVDSSFPAAFRRGKRFFWFTFGRLAFGPTLFTISTLVFIGVLVKIGIPVNVYGVNGDANIVGAFVSFITNALHMFTVAITATVLCKTYLRSVAVAEHSN